MKILKKEKNEKQFYQASNALQKLIKSLVQYVNRNIDQRKRHENREINPQRSFFIYDRDDISNNWGENGVIFKNKSTNS